MRCCSMSGQRMLADMTVMQPAQVFHSISRPLGGRELILHCQRKVT